jgi:hypothetical protein
MRSVAIVLACAVAVGGPACAQESEEAALTLADKTSTAPTVARTCIEYAEAAAIETGDGGARNGGRASFSVRCDGALAGRWRGVLSDRFDELWGRGMSSRGVNTLKEAYVSFRPDASILADLGRINVREGVALAYNPTDYFKSNSIRTLISIDPETLRDERMGTLMGRVQTLWASGSLTAIFAPHVDARPNDSTFNPDFAATNGASRWLLLWSQRWFADFQPQISVTGAEHGSPRAGLDLTHLLNNATVGYLEWSDGRSGNSLSTGLTYTTSVKLSLTLEYEYDETGELGARQKVFAYAHWDDAGLARLGLTAFIRFDPSSHSRVVWSEARYHWQHAGVALQWQHDAGSSWVALVDYYF